MNNDKNKKQRQIFIISFRINKIVNFELLDSIKHPNFYRVYPHTLFCDNQIKGRCLTHDNKDIFYVDDNHPSAKGAEMINDLILKEIKKIEVAR